MSRIRKQERQALLQEKLNRTPFATDEELAAAFQVSVPTIRLDRLELGIPELRVRIKAVAEEHAQDQTGLHGDIVGELIDLSVGQQGISMLHTTREMTDPFGFVDPQYLYAQADSLAKAVMNVPAAIAGVGNLKYKEPVGAGRNLVAKAEVVRRRGTKHFIWVFIKDKEHEVFRAKFIMEPIEDPLENPLENKV